MDDARLRDLALALWPRKAPATSGHDLARRLLNARRSLVQNPGCPAAYRRRASALFGRRPATLAKRVATLILDSWSGLAPATRGRALTRLLRYACVDGILDVELSRSAQGEVTAQFAIEASGRASGLDLISKDGEVTHVPLDELGVCSTPIPASGAPIGLAIRNTSGIIFQVEAVGWES